LTFRHFEYGIIVELTPSSVNVKRKSLILCLVLLIQALALAICLIIMMKFGGNVNIYGQCPASDQVMLYSPAQEALEYEVKTFTVGKKHKTKYQGLSLDVDRAWGQLYNNTIFKMPKSQAALLPNRTYPIKDDPGYYLGALDVFHQLHCLNTIRRALHREHYTEVVGMDEEHISHCVDSVRQSLMCNADISVNVWQWNDQLSNVVGHSTQAHTCRNFEKLRDWSRERRVHRWIDMKQYVQDDLPDPPIIH